jgi:CxxC-x17-CxxC domain-containing protein
VKVPRWYQRRRLRRLLIGEGIAPELAERMLRQQLDPQLLAQHAREEGVDIDAAFVTTNPEHNGFEVTCRGCGRTAKLPFQLPAGKVALCPDCMRAGRTGEE